jgi:hypothetical protein
MRLAIGIATTGRAAILSDTLRWIGQQTRLPERVVICPVSPSDVGMNALSDLSYPAQVVSCASGLPTQRNAIIAATLDMDALVFLDDDFFPAITYLANAERLLLDEPNVVLATGALIEDGIHGPGLDPDYARAKLAATAPPSSADGKGEPHHHVYGCNMVVRLAPVLGSGIRFDAELPLYAWQEDVDFARQMAPFGRIVRSRALTGIHLGTKHGRTSGVKFGYSQIANPIYLMRKGTMSVSFGTRTMAKNVAANLARSVRPEPHVDRIGRCIGNLMAIGDILRGRLHPRRILEI